MKLSSSSVIGPQVFTYYSHIIGKIIKKHSIDYHLYADDGQLLLSFDPCVPGDAECALFRLSCCVLELQAVMAINKLMVNPEKTEFFIAASEYYYGRLQHHNLHLGDVIISPTRSVRNLGAVFDCHMKMDEHVAQLTRSLNFHIRNLARIRRFLDFDSCHHAVRSLILAKLDYCGSLLCEMSQGNINRLQKIQNRCARLIFKKSKFTETSPLLTKLHWLPVAQRVQFRTLVHTFKCLNSLSPKYLSSLLKVKETGYNLRSSVSTTLHVRKTSTLWGDRSFSVVAPFLWNSLPAETRGMTTLSSFKRSLKSVLFPR